MEIALATKEHQPTEPSTLESSSTARNAVIGSVSGPPMDLGTKSWKRLASAIALTNELGNVLWA